jgi:hypothetical protein
MPSIFTVILMQQNKENYKKVFSYTFVNHSCIRGENSLTQSLEGTKEHKGLFASS